MNPSVKGQRASIVALGVAGMILALVCTMHAKGAIPRLWEPLPVVTAEGWVLPAVPAPMPELDLIGFAAVVLLTSLGGDERWRTRPRLVFATGAAVALTAGSLVVRWTWQYVTLGTTSTLFFLTTAAAVAGLPLVADEVYAAAFARNEPGSYDVWLGARLRHGQRRRTDWSGYFGGIGAIVIGFALLLVPVTMFSVRAAKHGHLLGAVVATIGAISLARVARSARWMNAAIGAWLLVAPLAFGYSLRGTVYSIVMGLSLMIVSTLVAEPERMCVSQRIW